MMEGHPDAATAQEVSRHCYPDGDTLAQTLRGAPAKLSGRVSLFLIVETWRGAFLAIMSSTRAARAKPRAEAGVQMVARTGPSRPSAYTDRPDALPLFGFTNANGSNQERAPPGPFHQPC